MNLLITLIAASAVPQTPQVSQQAEEPKLIIVTAKRLDVTERALKACIERKCPPEQEIDAALAHAENLFVDGQYHDANGTLLKTIGHVKRYTKQYPEAVADLWRAQSRISTHMGERDQTRIAQIKSLDALRGGIAKSDSRVFSQRIAVADTFSREGRIDLAIEAYRDIARDASKARQPIVEGTALLRVALIQGALYELQPNAFGIELDRSVDAVLATRDPVPDVYRDAARLLRARLTVKPNDATAVDQLVAQFAPAAADRPILVYQPPQNFEQQTGRTQDGRPGLARSNASYEGQWVDVAFQIRSDGRVEDVGIVREGPSFDRRWIEPTLATIAGRRYAPMTIGPNHRSLRRVERYTQTAYWEVPTGTRIRQRGYPRIEMLDLSNDMASSPSSPRGASAKDPSSTPAK